LGMLPYRRLSFGVDLGVKGEEAESTRWLPVASAYCHLTPSLLQRNAREDGRGVEGRIKGSRQVEGRVG
jgi:hypothetical protein